MITQDVKKDKDIDVKKWAYEYFYRAFSIIPLQPNSKTPLIPWKEFQNRHMKLDEVNKYFSSNVNIGIVTGQISSLIVFDADSQEDVDFLESMPEFQKTASVKTRRGKHYYFSISDLPVEFSCTRVHNRFIDIKANGGYVVAPPSRVVHEDGTIHEYQWCDKNIQILRYERLLKILTSLEIPDNHKDNNTKNRNDTDAAPIKIDEARLIQLIRQIWRAPGPNHPGNRQDIIFCLAGFLRKNGLSEEETWRIIQRVCLTLGDDPSAEQQRRSAVTNTYLSHISRIKGLKGLVELGLSEEQILSCIQHTDFVIHGNMLFYQKVKDGKINREMIGPALRFHHILYDEESHKRCIYVTFDKYQFSDIKYDRENIENLTKIPVLNTTKFREYIAQEIEKLEAEKRYKYLIRRTGWLNETQDIFCIPSLHHPDVVCEHPEHFRFTVASSGKQHEIVRYSLKNGTELGILYLCALSAIFLKDLGTRGYTVIITGPAGVGKTTSSKLACSLFYDTAHEIDLNATRVARERILYSFCDLPVLLDEAALERDDFLQDVIFMLATGNTKKRGTIDLNYYFSKIRNVLIITSEREPKFDRLGAFRRVFRVLISDRQPLPYPAHECLTFVGAGIDFIKHYVAFKNELLKEKASLNEQCTQYYHLPILFALRFVENYYHEEFTAVRHALEMIFSQNEDDTQYSSYCLQSLYSFVQLNFNKFYAPQIRYRQVGSNIEPVVPPAIYGCIFRESGYYHIYFTVEAFRTFLNEFNLDRRSFLQTMEDKGILITNEGSRKTYRPYRSLCPLPIGHHFFYFRLPESDLESRATDMLYFQKVTKASALEESDLF